MSASTDIMSVEHPTDKANFYIVWTQHWAIAFSYQTIIGVNALKGKGWLVSVNEWSTTTGKHLNHLDRDKSKRVPHSNVLALANWLFDYGAELG